MSPLLKCGPSGTRCEKKRQNSIFSPPSRDGRRRLLKLNGFTAGALLDEYGTKFLDWWHDRLCVRVISTTIPMRHTYNFRLDLA